MVGTLPLLGQDFVKNARSLHHSTNVMTKILFYESIFTYLILFLRSVWQTLKVVECLNLYRESYTNNLIQTNQHFLYSFPVQVWDEGLATIARNYAEKCDFNHNKLRSSSVGYYVGENLYVSYGMYTYTGEHVSITCVQTNVKQQYTYTQSIQSMVFVYSYGIPINMILRLFL